MLEVDQVLARLRQMNGNSVTLLRNDAQWLLAEIDGSREAFGAVVQKKNSLEQQVKQMRLPPFFCTAATGLWSVLPITQAIERSLLQWLNPNHAQGLNANPIPFIGAPDQGVYR